MSPPKHVQCLIHGQLGKFAIGSMLWVFGCGPFATHELSYTYSVAVAAEEGAALSVENPIQQPQPSEVQLLEYYRHRMGVCVVFDPRSQEVRIFEYPGGGVAAIYDPKNQRLRVETYDQGGIALVYNEHLQQVERRTAEKRGIAGVYNPHLKKVDWQQARSPYHSVAGYYDPELQEVRWLFSGKNESLAVIYVPGKGPEVRRRHMQGVALLLRGAEPIHSQSCSFYGVVEGEDFDLGQTDLQLPF